MKKVLIALLAVLLSTCTSTKQLISTEIELEQRLAGVLDYQRLTGFSVSIFTKDSVIYQNAFGYSNLETKVPYTLDTKQIIASISKTTIAVALMKGQELGWYQLDDPINQHLPFKVVNPHFPELEITIRNLARHTSSIKYSEEMTDHRCYEYPEMGIGEFTRSYLAKEGKWYDDQNFHPTPAGELGDYSNVGATLIAYLIEYKSGMKFSDFAKKYIFEPLAMEETDYFEGNNSDANYYKYLAQNSFELVAARKDGMYPNGSQVSTIKELTRFCQAVMNRGTFQANTILTTRSVDEMLEVSRLRKSMDDEIFRQGILWSTLKNPLGIPREMIGHNGGDVGVYTMMYFDPKTGIGYILLSNTGMAEGNHVSFVSIYKSLWSFSRTRKIR